MTAPNSASIEPIATGFMRASMNDTTSPPERMRDIPTGPGSSFPEVALKPHDHAVIMGVLDYVADPHVFLCNLRPLIKVSVVASFPTQHWFRTPFRKFRYRLRRCPVFFYDQAYIKEVCAAAGFSGVEIQKISGAGMDYHVCLKP